MLRLVKFLIFLISIFVLILGCVSAPPPRVPTSVETRETSVMTERETMTININTDLFKAAFEGQTSELMNLLELEEDVEVKKRDGRIALLLASVRGHTEVVQILVDAGIDVNGETARGGTALMWAAGSRENPTEIVRVLLDAGADVNARTRDGCTALMDATMRGNTETVRVLIEAGAGVNEKTEDGVTALMEAGRLGYIEIVRLLLDNGADVNVRNREGRTALMEADAAAHTEIVQLLRDAGAIDELSY